MRSLLTVLLISGCSAIHTEANSLTGTTLAERCAFYRGVAEPIAALVAAGAALTAEEAALAAAFNALNCPAAP